MLIRELENLEEQRWKKPIVSLWLTLEEFSPHSSGNCGSHPVRQVIRGGIHRQNCGGGATAKSHSYCWEEYGLCLPSACLLACMWHFQNLKWEICWLCTLGNIVPRLPTFRIQGRAEKGSASQQTADRQYSRWKKKKGRGRGLLGFWDSVFLRYGSH